MFYLVLMKAKVGASWCDLYYTYSSFFCSVNINFLKLGGIWRRRKDIHRLSNFYNWLFICILYQWSFLYWKLKKKESILEKNCLASQCGLALTRSWVWPLGGVKQFFFFSFFFSFVLFFVSKSCLIFIWVWSLHVLHFVNQFRGRGWDPLNRGKFHVSICAVHIV